MANISASALASDHELAGNTPGAEVINVKKSREQIDLLSNIVYSQIRNVRSVRQLNMSLLVPRTSALKPALIYFPGGGFISTDYDQFIEMRMALAEAGFVVAAAEYRVVPDTFPAPLEDGKAAVRYLREHAKAYNIDPQRIGVLGDSAGGWMAQMLGTTNNIKTFDTGDNLDQSSAVQAVATLYGISNLLNIGEGFPEEIQRVHYSPSVTESLLVNGVAFSHFPGATIDSDKQKALNASPMGNISGNEPPFLIMHGSADTLVSPVQSAQLYNALKEKHDKVKYILLNGAEHGDISWFQQEVIKTVVEWFKQTLGAPVNGEGKAASGKDDNL
ncbi:Acetyl esterase/lipase [Kosakonia arachidis]|uniref:Acetyl esterase/lipase n=1 Tax=Kosakonia arachidis TaxID=551989 RepID=A0A1I6YRA1_9ENTR|nr:alpha/beta hydrolase [Kosakonia arachidis]SFT53009.1 Acetyl esterase/lipase [Kosakonia arachidis]